MFNRRDATTADRPNQDEAHRTPMVPPTTFETTSPSLSTPAPAAPPAARPAQNGDESLVAREDTFDGNLKTTRGVRVLGTVRGTIESNQYVHIEENAQVEADIVAAEVIIAGTYSGTLSCLQRVEIRATGHVSGKIETEKLMLHEGGYFDGELHMQKPAEKPNVAPPSAPVVPAPTESKDNLSRRPRHIELPSDNPLADRDVSGSGDVKL